jgi:uncharacterized protein YaiL (DUF2058 family)
MGNSLQNQLLKAGLANKKQAVKAKKAKNSKDKLKRAGVDLTDEAAQLAEKAKQEKLEKDRELNRQKTEREQAAAIAAQVRQLVQLNRVEERGDIEYKFPEGNLVKTLYLTERQRTNVINGVLAIVKTGERYDLVPRKAAEKIAERAAQAVLVCNTANDDAEDDEYADFQVPDDLMW